MARQREEGDDNEDMEEEDDKVEQDRVVKKRKEVTTASILENFLLLATSLEDTVREDAVASAMGAPTSKSRSGKPTKGESSKACVTTLDSY